MEPAHVGAVVLPQAGQVVSPVVQGDRTQPPHGDHTSGGVLPAGPIDQTQPAHGDQIPATAPLRQTDQIQPASGDQTLGGVLPAAPERQPDRMVTPTQFGQTDQAVPLMPLGQVFHTEPSLGNQVAAPMQVGRVIPPPQMEQFEVAPDLHGGLLEPVAKRPKRSGFSGEVRFGTQEAAQMALQLSGSELKGAIIDVTMDSYSKDGTKIVVAGIPVGVSWIELKEHFLVAGPVVYAAVKGDQPNGPIGSVKYESVEEAMQGIALLNGASLADCPLTVTQYPKDPSKLRVVGLPPNCEWQQLRDFFAQAGSVVSAEISNVVPPGMKLVGEVRYEHAQAAQQAYELLNGSVLSGANLRVQLDRNAANGSKILVENVPVGIQWQELKDHFSQAGNVAFAQIHQVSSAVSGPMLGNFVGKNSSKGKFMPMGMNMNPGMMRPMNNFGKGDFGKSDFGKGDFGKVDFGKGGMMRPMNNFGNNGMMGMGMMGPMDNAGKGGMLGPMDNAGKGGMLGPMDNAGKGGMLGPMEHMGKGGMMMPMGNAGLGGMPGLIDNAGKGNMMPLPNDFELGKGGKMFSGVSDLRSIEMAILASNTQ